MLTHNVKFRMDTKECTCIINRRQSYADGIDSQTGRGAVLLVELPAIIGCYILVRVSIYQIRIHLPAYIAIVTNTFNNYTVFAGSVRIKKTKICFAIFAGNNFGVPINGTA